MTNINSPPLKLELAEMGWIVRDIETPGAI
jgi:hypothetical protein